MAGNMFSTENSYKAGRNAPSFPSRCLANMPQRRSEVDLHGFSLHNPLASLLGLPISFSCDSVFSDVANCQRGTGLRSPNYFAYQPRSKQFSFPFTGLLDRFSCSLKVLIYSVEQQKYALFCLQTSLLKTVLLSNCTCTLQRGKGRDPEQSPAHVVLVKPCHLSCPTENQFN